MQCAGTCDDTQPKLMGPSQTTPFPAQNANMTEMSVPMQATRVDCNRKARQRGQHTETNSVEIISVPRAHSRHECMQLPKQLQRESCKGSKRNGAQRRARDRGRVREREREREAKRREGMGAIEIERRGRGGLDINSTINKQNTK